MDAMTFIWAGIAILVLVVGWAAFRLWRRRRLEHLFGTEYDRVVDRADSRREAESELRERMQRHDELDLVPLSADARRRYEIRWEELQRRFVDAPEESVRTAEVVVTEVMRERGYRGARVDEQLEMVSVDHPGVVERFRRAQTASGHRSATTEQLREAMIDYRAVFERLVDEGHAPPMPTEHREEVSR